MEEFDMESRGKAQEVQEAQDAQEETSFTDLPNQDLSEPLDHSTPVHHDIISPDLHGDFDTIDDLRTVQVLERVFGEVISPENGAVSQELRKRFMLVRGKSEEIVGLNYKRKRVIVTDRSENSRYKLSESKDSKLVMDEFKQLVETSIYEGDTRERREQAAEQLSWDNIIATT